jgi:hypothetical protein
MMGALALPCARVNLEIAINRSSDMQPRVKYGLIAGGVGLVINICVGALVGVCGPAVALVAGAAAGFFASGEEQAPTQGDGAREGALSGAIAGGLVLVGQLFGVIVALGLTQSMQIEPIIGTMPVQGDTAGQTVFWMVGLGVGLCFGLIGVALSAGAGAAAGYFNTSSQPSAMG